MAYALLSGRPHWANGEMAYHVLDIMHGFLEASERGTHYKLSSSCKRTANMTLVLRDGLFDE